MVCLICKQKFTQIQRKAHMCVKCGKQTCIRCIKKDFNLNFTSKCCYCSKYFHPEVYRNPSKFILDKIYTFIKEKESQQPIVWIKKFRQIAIDKVLRGKMRIKMFKDYLKKFPNDKKLLFMVEKEITLTNLFLAIETDSELMKCNSCSGQTTVNSLNLQDLCKLKILSDFENNTDPYILPKSITRDLFNIPYRKCLYCRREHIKTLLSSNKRVLERRCHSCDFLIMFYKRHDDIDTICCPKCSTMTSRWGGVVLQDLLHIYKTFFEFSCNLVHGDTRDY